MSVDFRCQVCGYECWRCAENDKAREEAVARMIENKGCKNHCPCALIAHRELQNFKQKMTQLALEARSAAEENRKLVQKLKEAMDHLNPKETYTEEPRAVKYVSPNTVHPDDLSKGPYANHMKWGRK